VHIAFGSIQGEDGKMFKTRSGDTVGLLEVIDEAIERARAAADEKDQGLSAKNWMRSPASLAAGAVKYAELSQNRLTDYKFAWDQDAEPQGQHRALPAQRLRPHPQPSSASLAKTSRCPQRCRSASPQSASSP
jgi:hypothetical protein